jgi:NTE family protein
VTDLPLPRPDVLVLAGGGILGEAWMTGVLAGLQDAGGLDLSKVETLVGTSAGSIVAATLAAGRSPRRPESFPRAPSPLASESEPVSQPPSGSTLSPAQNVARVGARLGVALGAPLIGPGLALGAPAGALLRGAVLSRLPEGRLSLEDLHRRIERLGARFDGRLRVVCVDRARGRRVVFGAPGSPRASVADAVTASCAIPTVFRSVSIGGRDYVDGGAWSITNLDVAPVTRGTQVLCLNPTAGASASLQSVLAAVRGMSRMAAAVEATALRRRGARLRVLAPDPDSAAQMGSNFMDPRPRRRVLAAGFEQGRRLGRS